MTLPLDIRVELVKIARLLGVGSDDVSYLSSLPLDELRALRDTIGDQLFAAAGEKLEKVAQAAKLAPAALAAAMAPKYFGATLSAALTGVVEPARALKIAPRLPVPFMADVATSMDPRKSRDIIAQVPVANAVSVGRELVQRAEYITLGRLVSGVPAETLRQTVDNLDDEAIVRTALVLEDKSRLDELLGVLPAQRLATVVHAVSDHGLWNDALELLKHLSPARRTQLADLVAGQDDAMLESLVTSAAETGRLATLDFLDGMSEGAKARFARVRALGSEQMLGYLVDGVGRSNGWQRVVPLLKYLPEDAQDRLARLPALGDRTVLGALTEASQRTQDWTGLLALVPRLNADSTKALADVFAAGQDIDPLVGAATRHGALHALMPLAEHLPPPLRDKLSAAMGGLGRDEMSTTFAAASAAGRLPELLTVAAAMPADAREQAVGVVVENADDDDLLGMTLDESQQQELWSPLLQLAQGVPAPLLGQLGERAASLQLDTALPAILQAAEQTGAWGTGLALVQGVNKTLDDAGLGEVVAVPAALARRAAEQAQALDITGGLDVIGASVGRQLTEMGLPGADVAHGVFKGLGGLVKGVADMVAPTERAADSPPAAPPPADAPPAERPRPRPSPRPRT